MSEEFYRIKRLPPYVFTEVNSLKGKPTIGTISVACALGYLDYRFAAMDWRAKHPKLAKWFNFIAKTPAMKATEPAAA